jgi:Protein of unknown function (DUF3489)
MTTFTIDTDNNITAFASNEEAATAGGEVQLFASTKELNRLASDWPAERLVAIWNGLPGIEAVTKFKSAKTGVARIWDRIQSLAEPAKPKAEPKAKGGAKAAKAAPAKGKATKKASPAKKAPKAAKGAKTAKASVPREGSKTAQVVAMLQRKNGATLEEIMGKMSWQKHTVRGFMAGAMKKAGYEVESFKSDKGERTYRINA